jgi:hypothetical protein
LFRDEYPFSEYEACFGTSLVFMRDVVVHEQLRCLWMWWVVYG